MKPSFGRFLRDSSGNFAIMGAFLSVPLVLGIGMTLDLSSIARTKAQLQSAIDSAVLAIAREGDKISDADAQKIAWQFLGGNFDQDLTKLTIDRDGTEFTVDAQTKAEMAFGNLFGYEDWPVEANASADIAYASYEIALVLDTTGSMKGGKLAAMKEAVLGTIDTMALQVTDKEKLKFALVPFSSFVNVGPGFGPKFDKDGKQIPGTGEPWLDLTGASDIPQSELAKGASRFQIYENLDQKWSGCVETRSAAYGPSDAQADPAKPETLFVPAFAIDEPDSGGYYNSYIASDAKLADSSIAQKKKRFAKYGVATDAFGLPLLGGLLTSVTDLLGLTKGAKADKIKIDTSASAYGGMKKGPAFGCVSQPITPLTNDYKAVKDSINALQAQGNTNIMEGVAWGMRALSPAAPFTQGKDKKKHGGIEKIMIVLTDGANTFGNDNTKLGSTYSSFGFLLDGRVGITVGTASATNNLMNQKTLAACEAAKAEGVEVYTIRLEEPDVATGTMLKECASTPDKYFDVPSRSQLDTVFSTIKDRMVRLRISS